MSLPRFIQSMERLTPAQKHQLAETYQFAREAHHEQYRRSGQAYISHPVAVSQILDTWNADLTSLQAGILHDVVEDTSRTLEEVMEKFGPEVAELVDGVTKIGQMSALGPGAVATRSVENIRKLLLAMSRDIRVILVKLADRLHNMRTLKYLSEEKQRRIAQETLDIFAPLADRLGMGDVKAELEDLAFVVVNPQQYRELQKRALPNIKAGKMLLDAVIPQLQAELMTAGVEAEIEHRIKHTYSLARKLEKYDQDFSKIRDLVAMRIIVPEANDCYKVLGVVHALYRPLPHFIKDYIAVPKPNGYQSLHTTVISEQGIFEVQIRSWKMHDYAERGLAAHFYYDEQKNNTAYKNSSTNAMPKKFEWVQNLLDWQEQITSEEEIKESFQLDLFKSRIFAFSPKGDLYDLPEGATPVDFAFHVHSALGLACRGAKVNGVMVPLDYRLQNRDVVEIFAAAHREPKPSRDWLGFVVSTKARAKIKAWFKAQDQTAEERTGRQLLDEYLHRQSHASWGSVKPILRREVLTRLAIDDERTLMIAISEGALKPSDVARELIFERNLARPAVPLPNFMKRRRGARPVALIPGIDREHISRAGCCSPQYPQGIVGFVSRLGVFRIHRSDCSEIDSQRERCVPAYWYFDSSDKLRIHGDASRTSAILKGVSSHLHGFDARAQRIREQVKGNEVQLDIDLSLVRMDRLEALISALRRLPGISSVEHMVRQSK